MSFVSGNSRASLQATVQLEYVALHSWILVYMLTALCFDCGLFYAVEQVWLEGWKAWAAVHWFAGKWSADGIRLYACI